MSDNGLAKKINAEIHDHYLENTKLSTQDFVNKLLILKGEIDRLVELRICSWCEADGVKLRDKKSKKEYLNSGLCQECQDQENKKLK